MNWLCAFRFLFSCFMCCVYILRQFFNAKIISYGKQCRTKASSKNSKYLLIYLAYKKWFTIVSLCISRCYLIMFTLPNISEPDLNDLNAHSLIFTTQNEHHKFIWIFEPSIPWIWCAPRNVKHLFFSPFFFAKCRMLC